ncbi:hypothetical protein HZB96_02245 [Candidatus Gottesmanbacteria bacterium]|nr:hypothetical protein [Candidatus Gottesmanbacteria bacterium]
MTTTRNLEASRIQTALEEKYRNQQVKWNILTDGLIVQAKEGKEEPKAEITVTQEMLERLGFQPRETFYEGILVLDTSTRNMTFHHSPHPSISGLEHTERVTLMAITNTIRPESFPFTLEIPMFKTDNYLHSDLTLAMMPREPIS